MSKTVFHWVYVSTVAEGFDASDLAPLLTSARKRNKGRGITGLLMHADNRFMQILEGSKENVEALSKIISRDPRHKDINTLRFEYKDRRDFADWKMGYARLKDGQYPEGFIPVLENFFSAHTLLAEQSESYHFVSTFLRHHRGDPRQI